MPASYKEDGWKVGEPRDMIDRGAWWSVYEDPVLDGLERQIDISNQTLRASEAAYRQAQAIVGQARAQYFPTVDADRVGDALRNRRRRHRHRPEQRRGQDPL